MTFTRILVVYFEAEVNNIILLVVVSFWNVSKITEKKLLDVVSPFDIYPS